MPTATYMFDAQIHQGASDCSRCGNQLKARMLHKKGVRFFRRAGLDHGIAFVGQDAGCIHEDERLIVDDECDRVARRWELFAVHFGAINLTTVGLPSVSGHTRKHVANATRHIPARFGGCYAYGLQPRDFPGVLECLLSGRWWLFEATRQANLDGLVRIGVGRDAAEIAFASPFGEMEMGPVTIMIEPRTARRNCRDGRPMPFRLRIGSERRSAVSQVASYNGRRAMFRCLRGRRP